MEERNSYGIMLVMVFFVSAGSFLFMQCSSQNVTSEPVSDNNNHNEVSLGSQGLAGHVGFSTPGRPDEYGFGFGFYTGVWPLVEQPLAGFQIGLPSSWISPDNSGFNQERCPEGTIAHAYFARDLFQSMEGGVGYWRGNRFHYDSPKFSMNGVPDCYNSEIASPGWPFFYRNEALPDDELGIAQLSNRLMIPPDGITFQGNLEGNFFGYVYMALPLTRPKKDPPPTGDHNWTLFFNTENFKGPVAYYLPEMWSRITKGREAIYGRGLDVQPGNAGGGAMEINTVPAFEVKDDEGDLYFKIPQLQFPLDDKNRSVLVQDVTYYSKETIYHCIEDWRAGGEACSGEFEEGKWQPTLDAQEELSVRQKRNRIAGLDEVLIRTITSTNAFAFQWKSSSLTPDGLFPRYFKQVGDEHIPVDASEVPAGLRSSEFPLAETETEYVNWRHNRDILEGDFRIDKREPYTTPQSKAWTDPGPSAGPYRAILEDGSEVTYYWYRFIDQPVFQQFDWSEDERSRLQDLIEQIHKNWSIDQDFITPPTTGGLISIDSALIVTPPSGMEYGYVPIVIRQE